MVFSIFIFRSRESNDRAMICIALCFISRESDDRA